MNNKKDFDIYFEINKDNTTIFESINRFCKLYIEEKSLLEISFLSKKQFDLYTFRNKEIVKKKEWKKRYISLNILNHVIKDIERRKNKIIKK